VKKLSLSFHQRDLLIKKIDSLPPKDRSEVLKKLQSWEAIQCQNNYFDFFLKAWTIIEPESNLVVAPYLVYLCNLLDKVVKDIAEGRRPEYRTILINIPPSMSKSTIVTKILPAWCWLQMPSMKIITASYSGDLALDHTVKTRDIIDSTWYQKYFSDEVKLKEGQKAKSHYENRKSGRRRATGISGGITGFHAHLFIIDDPQNPERAESEKLRKQSTDFWTKTVPSRILEDGVKIVVQQRLHEEDVTGYVLDQNKKGVLHIKLPARITDKVRPIPENLSGLYSEDGYLTPRLDEDRLQDLFEDMGELAFAGQYDQEPSPAGGNKFKRDWFEYVHESEVPGNLKRNLWIDGAYTKNNDNDPTGYLIEAYDKRTHTLYILNFSYSHDEIHVALERIEELAELFNLRQRSRVFFEPKASGHSMRQLVNVNTRLSAVSIRGALVQDGKVARAAVASPKVQAGKVKIVKGAWNKDFIDQLCLFPNAKHDEAIDLLGYACDRHFPKTSKNRNK
jgi:predicted phage terminase large subunit-like protein